MERIFPECNYFYDEKNSKHAPETGECKDCYRYELCKDIKEKIKDDKQISAKYIDPTKDSILLIEVKPDLRRNSDFYSIIQRIYQTCKEKFPFMRVLITSTNTESYKLLENSEDKQQLINKLKEIIEFLEKGN